jgi:hypothetical protein
MPPAAKEPFEKGSLESPKLYGPRRLELVALDLSEGGVGAFVNSGYGVCDTSGKRS